MADVIAVKLAMRKRTCPRTRTATCDRLLTLSLEWAGRPLSG
jgi:hypothetical protein